MRLILLLILNILSLLAHVYGVRFFQKVDWVRFYPHNNGYDWIILMVGG